ncbi:reverse transcriptase domain-containing protein [Tanacetum coccineum]
MAILMVQPWERVARQRITQSFSPNLEIPFPPLGEDEGTEGPMIIETKIGGHCVHRIYVDGGSALEILTDTILVSIGDEELRISFDEFCSCKVTIPYNGIIGRPGVRKLQAVPSTAHGILKIPIEGGLITLKSSRLVPLECAMVSGPERTLPANEPTVEERIKVAINPEYPEQTIMIGSTLTEEGHNKHIAEHRLNVRKGYSPFRQKKRGQAADRNQAIQEEVGKLVEAGIMREVHYHDWLSNPVMVKKHDNSWRMCVDFKDLNKACPKDGYPLPEIDWKVESLCGFPFKCFLDAYKGYHQIQMAKEDEEKNNFSLRAKEYFAITMSLLACGMPEPLTSVWWIKHSINRSAETSKLNGKLASLNRFLAKSAEKSLPFFKTLKKCTRKSDFYWTTEAKEAFKKIKQLIAELPMLVAPMEKEELIVYLAATKKTVSAVLMTEREAKQMPIYFISRALRGPEVNYTSMEKLVLALVHASKGLKRPRVSVKGQILANFIVERPEKEFLDTVMGEEEELPEPWILFTDGSSCIDGFGEGLILTNPEGIEFAYALRFRFDATNNDAKYEALIAGLKIAEQMGVKNLQANVDSRLVANQVNGTYVAKETDMVRYLEKVKNNYYSLLMHLNLTGPLQANYVLREIHEGSCSMHAGTRSVMAKALRIGYYWPTMHEDARKLIRACQDCQVHKPVPRSPQQKLSPITSPWPFYKWGIDIAGPFPEGPRKVKFLIVAIDYFTKWIEAKPVATITGNQIKKFVWDNIVCRFGLPGEIISDNGKQFQDNPFKDWCEKLCIRQHFASVKHPQTNGLVERANRSLGEGIKARLDERSKNWMEELPHVLWAHRTMIKSSNGDTPFSLTYGTEAVIPAEIDMPTLRTAEVDLIQNDEALEINLDLLEERREQASIREAKSKAKMERYYNSKVRSISFKPGDLVYRNNDAIRAEDTRKLGPKWEGPYEVTEVLGKGAYKLRDRDGKQLPRTWNISNLKRCYVHQM